MSDRDAPIVYLRLRREGNAEAVRLDETTRVLSFAFEDTEAGADKVTFSLDNYDLKHFDEPILREGDIVEASWGYYGRMSTARECVIQKITGGAVLKVEGHGKAMLLHKTTKTRTFRTMKRSDVARQLATENGYGVDLQDIDDTKETIAQINQAGMTDAALLADMARREGMRFYVDQHGFHFHARRLGQAPMRKFTWFVDGLGDMLAFPNVETDITAKPGAVTLKGRDPLKKTDIEARADNDTTKGRPALATVITLIDEKTLARAGTKTVASEATAPTTQATQASAARHAKGVYRNAQLTAVKLSFPAVGDPRTDAKTVVELANIGALIAGNYYLTNVSHKVLPAPYTMDVKARRDGTNGVVSGGGGLPVSYTQEAFKRERDALQADMQKARSLIAQNPEIKNDPMFAEWALGLSRRELEIEKKVAAATDGLSKGKLNNAKAPDAGVGDELEPVLVVDEKTLTSHIEYRERGPAKGSGS